MRFLIKYIIAENNAIINAKTYFYQLDGDEYDIKKEEITRKLSEGQKLFVVSVYQTIGAGQNLQYKIPSELEKELIKINDRPSRGEKDFDAIYLDKPTNLLVNLGNNLSEEEFVKYLYHTEFFQETSELSIYSLSVFVLEGIQSCFFSRLLSIIYAITSWSTILAYVFTFTRLSFPATSTAVNSSA